VNDLLIENIGQIVSGNFQQPLLDGDAILLREGKIDGIGSRSTLPTNGVEQVVDAGGCQVWPGLIDSHVHVVFGDFTPRQRALDFIDSCMHGGVTSMISAGEVHISGRPSDAVGLKSLAILAAKSFNKARPSGVKVMAGGVILAPDMIENDFKEMAEAGVTHLGEIGLGAVHDWDLAATMVKWGNKYGLKAMMHTGGASIPGSTVIGAAEVLKVQPDVAAHLNGGPTATPIEHTERIIKESKIGLEIVQCGNISAIKPIIELAQTYQALDRIIIGTDMPSGTGMVALGVLRTMASIASLGNIAPELTVAMATGNTANIYDLPHGEIAPGKEADLIIVDAPLGSVADDALSTLEIGDTVAVGAVIIDGVVRVNRSRNTPPTKKSVSIPWMQAGGH
jgi:enamidase